MKYTRILLSLLLLVSVFAYGCANEEDEPVRGDSTAIITNQDKANLLKYQFEVMYEGKVLTNKDATFMWDFGDATSVSSKAAPIHNYSVEGERKVNVTVDLKSEDGVSKRLSKDIVILVGQQLDVYASVITANSGPAGNILNYTFISSSLPSEANGNKPLNYKWVITGPGKDGKTPVTKIYPEKGEKPITKNTIEHKFDNFGKFYNIDLYVKSADDKEFNDKPSASMYMRTVLPTIELKCISIGKAGKDGEKVRCEPIFDYQIKHGMEYKWNFYSVNSDGVLNRDGTKDSTSTNIVIFTYPSAGLKKIAVEGKHRVNMDGVAEGEATIQLNSTGILNPVKCKRPTDHLGNFIDESRLEYECKAEGFINVANTNKPEPLTKYTWKISEDGTPLNADGFSWGTGDNLGQDKVYDKPNVKTRVDCNYEEGVCVTTLKFTADKYGAKYDISLSAEQKDLDDNNIINQLGPQTSLFYTEMPKITMIKRKIKKENPMESVFVPQFDTKIPDSIALKSTWMIEGSKFGINWFEEKSGKKYNGKEDGVPAIIERELTHGFSKSGSYNIQVNITSDKFSDSYLNTKPSDVNRNLSKEKEVGIRAAQIEMPGLTDTSNKLKFELSQNMEGSYFNYSADKVSNIYSFFTDYVSKIDGKPVSTVYVVTISGGPMLKRNPRSGQFEIVNEAKLIFRDKQEFDTLKYTDRGQDNNNVKMLYNVNYHIVLEVYNALVYGDGSDPLGTEGVTYKRLEIPNGVQTGDLSITTYSKPEMQNTWYQDFYVNIDNGGIGIDRSLFSCVWVADTKGLYDFAMGTKIPLTMVPDPNKRFTFQSDCSQVLWLYYFNKGGEKKPGKEQKLEVHVHGPYVKDGQIATEKRSITYRLTDPR